MGLGRKIGIVQYGTKTTEAICRQRVERPCPRFCASLKKAFISMRFGQSVHTNTLTVFENALESGSKRNENSRLHIVEAMWTVQNGTVNQTPT